MGIFLLRFAHTMNNETVLFDFEKLLQRLRDCNVGCHGIWKRISPHKRGDYFETQKIASLTFTKNKLNFFYATVKTPFTSLSGYFERVNATGSNRFKVEIPDTEYNISDEIFADFAILSPNLPEVCSILQEWLQALEGCHTYLSAIEAELVNIRNLEQKVISCFEFSPEPGQHIRQVTFTPKKMSFTNVNIDFTVDNVDMSTMENIIQCSYAIFPFYDPCDIAYVNEASDWTWEITRNLLELSQSSKTVRRTAASDSQNCVAIGSVGWDCGIHSWTLRVDGPIGGATTAEKLSMVMLGVATKAFKLDLTARYYVSGQTFGHCTDGEGVYYNMGRVSGSSTAIPPNTVVGLSLDCDAGTLAFSKEGLEFLKIFVPKNTTLYPWVHLHTFRNSVTIETCDS
eukprot:TRINITY_DN4664_c0_g1_i1.p1 TRINITY_DN4664_c0_g1~~TRINITY_DN4664_c0_g1_i1.p1  ORF type:complete len:399 (-),score=36.50 TRINITY_DN4664_c0_g1_i1:825-2021(-)